MNIKGRVQLISKDGLRMLCENHEDEFVFDDCISEAIDLCMEIKEAKKKGVDAKVNNYVRILIPEIEEDLIPDNLFRLLVCVRGWITAYSNTNRMVLRNISKIVRVDQRELIDIIDKYGHLFALKYYSEKDKYRKTTHFIEAENVTVVYSETEEEK